MLPARYRMTRPADFNRTVRCGVRSSQADIVVHGYRSDDHAGAPLVGLIVSKSVGGAVQRHRVARQLRHAARVVIDDLGAGDRVVVRALPGSSSAETARLTTQLRAGVRRVLDLLDRRS